MTTMTREEAIEEFGLTAEYFDGNARAYAQCQSYGELRRFMRKSVRGEGDVTAIYQKFGARNYISLFKVAHSVLPKYATSLESEVDLDEVNRDFHENVKKDVVQLSVDLYQKTLLLSRFSKKSDDELKAIFEKDRIIDAFVANMSVEINFLSEDSKIEKSSLRVDDKVYRVFDNDISRNGVSVSEYRITSRELLDDRCGKYKILFTACCSDGHEKEFMHTDKDGFPSYMRQPNEEAKLFASKEDARKYVLEIWAKVESNRQKYFRNNPKMK